MSVEHRRSPRLTDFLPLEVHVLDRDSTRVLAGPFAGRIIDISMHGACLLMSQVFRDGFHLFHTTRDNDSALLHLTFAQPPDLAGLTLIALPVWMDLYRLRGISAFKMGVDFTENPEAQQMKELQRAIRQNQEQRASWWQRSLATLGHND